MMNKILKSVIFSFVLCICIFNSTGVYAKYVRQNTFMDKSGYRKVEEIKRFQALSNLPVTGKLDGMTNKVLYNQNMVVQDVILTPPTNGDWITVNTTTRVLTYYHGKSPIYKFPVTVGASDTPTPSAKGKIANMHKNPAWGGMGGKYSPALPDDPKNPLGERWMGLSIPGTSGYGIHGNIKPHQLGQYASNGCIRMFNYDIEQFVFPRATVGMPVWIGTAQELKSWGVEQLVYEAADPSAVAEPKAQPKQDKPVETEYRAEELLVF